MNRKNFKVIFLLTIIVLLVLSIQAISSANVTDTHKSIEKNVVKNDVTTKNIAKKDVSTKNVVDKKQVTKKDSDIASNKNSEDNNVNLEVKKIPDEIENARNIHVKGIVQDDEAEEYSDVYLTFNEEEFSTIPDGDGSFDFYYRVTEIGKYDLSVFYESENGEDEYVQSFNVKSLNNTKITPILKVDEISNVTFPENIEITGRVTDSNGEGLVNVNIELYTDDDEEFATETESDGEFTFYIEKYPGNYTGALEVNDDDYKYVSENVSFSVSKIPIERDDLKLTLDPIDDITYYDDAVITGTVLDNDENPVENILVKFVIDDEEYYASSDEDGVLYLELYFDEAGVYEVIANIDDEKYENDTVSETFTVTDDHYSIEFDDFPEILENVSHINISGHVVDDDGNYIPDVLVEIEVDDEYDDVYTDEDGYFEYSYRVYSEDDYEFTVSIENHESRSFTITVLSVKEYKYAYIETEDETITVGQNVAISGYLYDEDDNPLANKTISLISDLWSFDTTTDEEGYFFFEVDSSDISELYLSLIDDEYEADDVDIDLGYVLGEYEEPEFDLEDATPIMVGKSYALASNKMSFLSSASVKEDLIITNETTETPRKIATTNKYKYTYTLPVKKIIQTGNQVNYSNIDVNKTEENNTSIENINQTSDNESFLDWFSKLLNQLYSYFVEQYENIFSK